MGFSGMFCLVPLKAEAALRYAPELGPAIEAEAALPASRDLLRWWQEKGSTGETMDRFVDAAGPSVLDERICLVYAAWERGHDASLPHLGVCIRKRHPAAALAFALGPLRCSALPGWFGDVILTPEDVVRTLPAVERAFTWTTEARRRAELLLSAALGTEGSQEDIDTLLDGIPPVWRAAAEAGRGLLGAQFVP
ncbi:hypothetical protein ACIRST_09960 [Kitasatospora sp. NPDC101447]|uniref:hypothetical protein n=1 Tax=Kitasatospora sp. NPDC101447 TaxID=3364102 RepID=UPI0038005837